MKKRSRRAADALAEAIAPEAAKHDDARAGPRAAGACSFAGKYRWHLLLKAASAPALRAVAARGFEVGRVKARPSSVRVVADVDPVECCRTSPIRALDPAPGRCARRRLTGGELHDAMVPAIGHVDACRRGRPRSPAGP